MKVIVYLLSTEEDRNKQLIDIHKQKLDIFDYCKIHNHEIIECKTESLEKSNNKYPIFFDILTNHNNFDRIIFYDSNIFDNDPEFKEWIFDELKSKNIRFDFVKNNGTFIKEDNLYNKKQILIEKAKNIPALPNTIVKTLQLIRNEKSSAWQLAKIIKYDTGLAGKILKLVNSTFYGFPKEISSIQHGITILGFNTIKGLVISSNIYKSFKNSSIDDLFEYKHFWLHTTLCATFANEIAQICNCYEEEKEEIFSSAILHDIGKLILAQYDTENYKNVIINQTANYDPIFNLNLEEKFCALTHTQIGKLVTESWNLPEIISQTAEYHHMPLSAKQEYQKVVSIISISDILSNSILTDSDISEELFDENILLLAQVNYNQLVEKYNKMKDAPDKINDLKNFFE